MSVRRARFDESDEIAHVFRLARASAMPSLPSLHTLDEDRAFIRSHVFKSCKVWVADEGIIVGFCAIRAGWVDHLYVHPQFQRRGFGRALLRVAKDRWPTLHLWIFQRNHNAIPFYESEGFQRVRETDGAANEEHEPDALYVWSR